VQAVTNDACTDAHADKLDGNGSELAVPPTAITMTPKVIISEMGITAAERSAGQLLEKLTHLSLDKETSKKYAQVLSAVTISPGIITSLCADDEAEAEGGEWDAETLNLTPKTLSALWDLRRIPAGAPVASALPFPCRRLAPASRSTA
jgi:hypothetical protein